MNDNWGLIGHQWAVELLKGHLKNGGPRHAYLFVGPQGVGRRTLALRLAQAINTVNPTTPGEFDPQDPISQQFEKMQHPDFSLLERQEGDKNIKIDAVRSLQKTLILSPYTAKYRIALLRNFEEATISASNSILKTLEEPPGRVVMMVTAESPESLLATIVSRCEIIRLRPIPVDEVAQGLENHWNIPAKQASLLAHVSGGRPGYALYLNSNPELLEKRNQWMDEFQSLLSSNRVKRFEYASKIGKNKEAFLELLQVWLSYCRDILIKTTDAGTALVNLDRVEAIEDIAEGMSLEQISNVLKEIEKTIGLLKTNVNVRLAAEVLLLDLPYI